jgi:hypothetical protein
MTILKQVSGTATQVNILILSANPKGTDKLRLDEELREIENGLIERSKLRDKFKLIIKTAVRRRDFQRAMLDTNPQIVHFSGHGGGKQGIALEDETGHVQLLNTEALAALFDMYRDEVTCVVMNACYSEEQAKIISQYIPYVIGMGAEIGDKVAIDFAVAFYDAIGSGRDIEFAYKNACVAIVPQDNIPVLHQRRELPEINKYIFSDLERFLQNHQWEDADGETARLMILLSGDKSETQFKIDAIDDFPLGELLKIDSLWKEHSQGKFGFTIQKNIWSRSKRNFNNFSSKVGWRIGKNWLTDTELKYDYTAPEGHLPSLNWIHIHGWGIGSENSGHSLYKLL